MIDVHKRLTGVFATLPEVMGMKPNYKWGDEMHLNQLIKLYNNDSKNPYPLIYNVSNNTSQDEQKQTATYNTLSLVIAYRNLHTDHTNPTRWATSYKDMLFPVAMNIVTLLKKSAIFQWNEQYELFEFPNYGNAQENETTDIWDALRLDTSITINNNCLNTVYFKT